MHSPLDLPIPQNLAPRFGDRTGAVPALSLSSLCRFKICSGKGSERFPVSPVGRWQRCLRRRALEREDRFYSPGRASAPPSSPIRSEQSRVYHARAWPTGVKHLGTCRELSFLRGEGGLCFPWPPP